MCHFYDTKSDMQLSEVDDSSNESFYYPDEELDPNLRKGIPGLKKFQTVDINTDDIHVAECAAELQHIGKNLIHFWNPLLKAGKMSYVRFLEYFWLSCKK